MSRSEMDIALKIKAANQDFAASFHIAEFIQADSALLKTIVYRPP